MNDKTDPLVMRLKSHIPWVLLIVVPNWLGSFVWAGTAMVAFHVFMIAMWVYIPCKDKYFGNGSRLFWIRQSTFVLSSVVALFIGVLFE